MEALEGVGQDTTVVMILEDLHWSDPSTVELLSALAQRRTPSRLFIIGTYRPIELVLGKHPLKGVKQELQAHGQCRELRVELLRPQAVREYLARRFPHHTLPPELATLIHRRTEGNALFMVNCVEDLGPIRIIQKL
jgi:predicted ATPase